MKKKKNNSGKYNLVTVVLVAAVSLFMGTLVGVLSADKNADPLEIELAKRNISAMYESQSVSYCGLSTIDGSYGSGKYQLTYRYMRINDRADRAIISDCSGYDTLLAKNKSGKWEALEVNLQLDNRATKSWQKACGIEDITVTDDQERPENSSIDQSNLEICTNFDK